MEVREPNVQYLAGPRFKRTESGLIPEDWTVRPMFSAARIVSGLVDPRNEPYRSMTLLAPDHVESGTGRMLQRVTAADQGAISGKYLVSRGDVVYSKIRPHLRKAALADFDGLCSADMYPLRAQRDVAPGYLVACLLGHHFSRYAEAVSARSGMPKVNRQDLADYKLALPPTLGEQESIAKALSDADALIESLDQLLAKERQIKQGTMQELLTGQRRLPGFADSWSWQRRTLSDLAEIRSGGTPSTARPEFWNGEVPWCTPTDITTLGGGKYLRHTSRKLSPLGLVSCSAELLPAGSIVMTSRATIGECAINTVPLATNQGFKNFLPYTDVDAEFLYYLLSMHKQGFIRLCAGSTFLEIGKSQIASYEVSLPSKKEEQTAIATTLSDMDAEITALEARLAKARALKQGMAQALLTGRIRLA